MITLPKAPNVYSLPQWNQPNDSDVNGSLWTTTNIDTSSNIGKLRVGDRMLLNTSDTSGYGISSVSEMRLPVVFKAIDSTPWIYTIAGAKLLNNNGVISGSFNTITPNSGSLPTNLSGASDMELFNGYLYTTGNTNVVNKIASLNTASPNITNFTAGGTDVTEKHLTSYASRMYMSRNSSNIISWDTSDTVATSGAYTVELGGGGANQIVWLRSSSNRIWIGTINQLGGKGYIYEWDGTATQVTKSYRLESSGTLSCVIKDDIPYVMDVYGNLLYWNGGTFVKLTGLNRKDNFLLYNPLVRSDNGNRFIHSNGMSIIKGKICVLIDTRNYNTLLDTEETIPAGIYEYDETTKDLKHKYSLSYLDRSATRVDNEDFGQTKVSAVGALSELNFPSTGSTRNGTFLAGATIYTDATTALNGIWYDDSNRTKQKAGSFITTKLQAIDANGNPSIQNMYQNLYVLYKQLIGATDKITVKYRISEQEPVEATITWTSTTTFTVLNSAVNISNYWTVGIGGEVEVLNGIGAGRCSHITNAVLNSGTWTVTVDETYTGASNQTAIARFQNWTKYPMPITYNNSITDGVTFDQEGIGKLANWIQFKVWMLFTGKDELEKLIIINQNYNPSS